MTDKEKIRAYIEKLHKEHRGSEGDSIFRRALRTVLFYIDSMQEEPASEDLDEAVNNYIKENGYDGLDSREEVKYIANHFAQWQKEQMMAKAIDATIEEPEPLLWEVLGELEGLFVVENNLHDGDGVKVIIVKEG